MVSVKETSKIWNLFLLKAEELEWCWFYSPSSLSFVGLFKWIQLTLQKKKSLPYPQWSGPKAFHFCHALDVELNFPHIKQAVGVSHEEWSAAAICPLPWRALAQPSWDPNNSHAVQTYSGSVPWLSLGNVGLTYLSTPAAHSTSSCCKPPPQSADGTIISVFVFTMFFQLQKSLVKCFH